MFFSVYTSLALILSIFCTSIAAADVDVVQALAPRQSPNANQADAATAAVCSNYAIVANRSTIALNSTYRAAFLRSAPLGTDAASSILDTQKPKLMALMMDQQLNAQCGNLSEVATAGAALNFTNGIVSEFPILDAAGVGVTGLHVPLVVIGIVLLMGGTFMSI
ncbi:hypothetical protein BJ170DRAFT_460387 [Xylariales sp. AK1849]|nr:hypothetical protein BJ170DRAFT_460387 [Xylariales sp. AK1849]